jgi:hypothetical protein
MTTSPSNSRTQPDLAFPRFAIRDMVASQQKAVGCAWHPKARRRVLGALHRLGLTAIARLPCLQRFLTADIWQAHPLPSVAVRNKKENAGGCA